MRAACGSRAVTSRARRGPAPTDRPLAAAPRDDGVPAAGGRRRESCGEAGQVPDGGPDGDRNQDARVHQQRPVGRARQGPRRARARDAQPRGHVSHHEDAVAPSRRSRRPVATRVQGADGDGVPRGAGRGGRDPRAQGQPAHHRAAPGLPLQGTQREGPGHQRSGEVQEPRQGARDRRGTRPLFRARSPRVAPIPRPVAPRPSPTHRR